MLSSPSLDSGGHWDMSFALSAAAACGGMSYALLAVARFLQSLGYELCSLSCVGARGYERCSPRRRIFSFFLGQNRARRPFRALGTVYRCRGQRRTRDTQGVTVTETVQRRGPAGLFARNVNRADQIVDGLAKIETNKMRDCGGCVAASNNHGFVVADFG